MEGRILEQKHQPYNLDLSCNNSDETFNRRESATVSLVTEILNKHNNNCSTTLEYFYNKGVYYFTEHDESMGFLYFTKNDGSQIILVYNEDYTGYAIIATLNADFVDSNTIMETMATNKILKRLPTDNLYIIKTAESDLDITETDEYFTIIKPTKLSEIHWIIERKACNKTLYFSS